MSGALKSGALEGREVTVLGAGVAGLALARALALRGARVTVIEQASAITEVGAGLQVTPNGAAVLHALGLGEALAQSSVRASAVELRDGRDGDIVLRMDLAALRPGLSWSLCHRADLIGLLETGAREAGVTIRLAQRVVSVDLDADRPVLALEGGERLSPRLLIGADGLHSTLRAALNGPAEPFFTGQVAWRALVPEIPGAAPVAEIHMGPGRHLVSYPLRGGRLRNIVAVEERRGWTEEGWNLRDDPLGVQVAFERFSPRVRQWLTEIDQIWLWGLFRHPVARRWGKVWGDNFVAILGDSAHPTLPFLAQGANMALEDAWVLTELLDQHGPGEAALAGFEAARTERCARVVAAADSNARAYHLSGLTREAAHLALRMSSKFAPGAGLARYDWIYGHDVTRPV